MLSLKTLAALRFSSAPQPNNPLLPSRPRPPFPSSLQSKRKKPLALNPLKYQFGADDSQTDGRVFVADEEEELRGPKEEDEMRGRTEEKAINGIHVPRQKYISVSKAELLDAVVSMFEVKEEADEFVQLSRCLDSILHAEHKGMLEKMRIYYSHTHSPKQKATDGYSSVGPEDVISTGQHLAPDDFLDSGNRGANYYKNKDNKTLNFPNSLDFRSLFASFAGTASTNASVESRVSVANDFQHSFMKLLHDAQFEELSAQDLLWTYALNSDYLLTLPIYVDWKKASESNAIIFRRGYATEKERGLLLVEKLDYLQSKLLQAIFFSLSRPLKITGSWLNKLLKSSTEAHGVQNWIEKLKLWLKEKYSVESTLAFHGNISSNQLESDRLADSDLPIWLAAQRAIPRYEGFLSSAGPRGRLIRKLLIWTGIIPSLPETSVNLDSDTKHAEAYLRPNFLPRVTLSNIWEPATKESCGNDVWKMLKSSVSILFSSSTLQEPAFQELILLYNEETSLGETRDKADEIPLQLKIYERIPIPELPVIFPHKKLSFRILDTVRLDVASILGLLAYFVNYKFENIASSPSAVLLDVIAFSALVIYVSRIVLGYKQTWDRYQLLVNKTLYEKTLASGFGSVHFLLDASEQQQYKEAILVYAILLRSEKCQVSCRKSIKDACERFMYDKFKEKIEMPIEKSVKTLLRLDLVSECSVEGNLKLKAIPISKGHEILRKRWDCLLGQET